ncbi:hypothetical protein MRS44_013058 [Fusarium solani]|uniref:uncharacterized protein n=1 Tax=Fusarium solani TaxID=169388 RepID=UPI0032C3F4C6|nr:hypothetical protein MRS44_013058 [Fusarium solani]
MFQVRILGVVKWFAVASCWEARASLINTCDMACPTLECLPFRINEWLRSTLSYKNFFLARVPNDTELRELLTSPPGAISYVVFAAYSYLDIPASRAFDISGFAPSIRFSRTTDLCSLSYPDDIRSILLLNIQGRRTLTLIYSLTLPRPTSAALSARTTPAAISCSTFWAL